MLTQEQQEIRSQGLTGSELAAACGVYPWAAPIDVYASKLGYGDPIDWRDSDGLIRGTLFEQPVRQWYGIKTGRQVLAPAKWAGKATDTLVHPGHPIVIATPDGISRQPGTPDTVVEVKCPSWRMGPHWGDEGTDAIPEYYLPQVIWEMAVTGLRMAHVVAYLGDAPRVYCVPWDEELFAALLETAERFWHDHVLARVPPPIDGSEAYGEWIARRCPNKLATYRPMTPEIEPHVRRLHAIRAQQKQLAAAEQEARNHITAFIDEYAGLDCGELGRIDWKPNKDTARTDWKSLCLTRYGANEDEIAEYTKTSKGNRPFTPRFLKGA